MVRRERYTGSGVYYCYLIKRIILHWSPGRYDSCTLNPIIEGLLLLLLLLQERPMTAVVDGESYFDLFACKFCAISYLCTPSIKPSTTSTRTL